jgi:simple sugar transport system substrate-binding protein
MDQVIVPSFKKGLARAGVNSLDFRVLGNWFDADKARGMAMDMYRTGSRVVLCIAGSANQGVIQAARESGGPSGRGLIVWFDTDGSKGAPDVVAGSAIVRQDKAAYEKTLAALKGTLPFGACESAGAAEGEIDFVPGPHVSAAVKEKMKAAVEAMKK